MYIILMTNIPKLYYFGLTILISSFYMMGALSKIILPMVFQHYIFFY